jgi:DNA polymerase-3 subunit delta
MILLLTGANDFAIRQALDKLVAQALNKHSAHAIERVDGEELDASRLPDLLQGASLFAPERLVILRGAAKNKSLWEALGDYADKVSEQVTLAVVEPSPDKRTRTYKQLVKYGKLHEFADLTEPQLAAWAVAAAKEQGAQLDQRTAAYLVRQVGLNQWQLHTELQKLIAAGDITRDRIDQLVEPSPQTSAFELLDAVMQGNAAKSSDLLNKLKASEDPYKLFGLLVSQVQTLAVVATAQGKTGEAIAKEAGVHPFVVRKMQPLARNLNYAQLQGAIATVARTDMYMKSTGIDPWTLLEQCLGRIASRAF